MRFTTFDLGGHTQGKKNIQIEIKYVLRYAILYAKNGIKKQNVYEICNSMVHLQIILFELRTYDAYHNIIDAGYSKVSN